MEEVKLVKKKSNRWRLNFGVHRDTLLTRDSEINEYDSEEEARKNFEQLKEWYESFGLKIWYADLYPPEGEKTVLDKGILYTG